MSSLGTMKTCLVSPRKWPCITSILIRIEISQATMTTILFKIMEVIESEVKKLIDSDFIRKEQHPEWVANIIPVF